MGGDHLWDAVAAIGQAVSALALISVFMQLRQAREAVQRTSRQARLDGSRELFLATAINPQLASALRRLPVTTNNPLPTFQQYAMTFGLTDDEGRQVNSFQWALWSKFQASIESVEHLSSGIKQEFDHRIRLNYSGNAASAKWYEITKPTLNPVAVRYVDNLLARPV